MKVNNFARHTYTTLDMPMHAGVVTGPETSAFPARIGIVDSPVQTTLIKPQGIRHAHGDHACGVVFWQILLPAETCEKHSDRELAVNWP